MVVGGGVNLFIVFDLFVGLSWGSFLLKIGGCKIFDYDVDGYVCVDVVGVIVLKRLDDVLVDRDNIFVVFWVIVINYFVEVFFIIYFYVEI